MFKNKCEYSIILHFCYSFHELPALLDCLTFEKHIIRLGFGIEIPEVALEATQDLNRIREASPPVSIISPFSPIKPTSPISPISLILK